MQTKRNAKLATPKPGLHYLLSCYVCGRGCCKPSPFEGWATFSQIFSERPSECRFAIARQVVLMLDESSKLVTKPDELWVCWDLLDADVIQQASDWSNWRTSGTSLAAPPPMWTSPSESGLIMKAMCLYDRN